MEREYIIQKGHGDSWHAVSQVMHTIEEAQAKLKEIEYYSWGEMVDGWHYRIAFREVPTEWTAVANLH